MSVIAFNLTVYSPDKTRLGDVRSIDSLQWLERYADEGEAKLVCAATDSNRQLLQNGNLLRNTDRPHLLAEIQSVEIDDDMKAAQITARAKTSVCRLAERVLMHTAKITEAEAGMLSMVQANLRRLPVTVAPAKGFAELYDGEISWGSVLDALKKVAEKTSLGFRITVNGDLQETFEVLRGIDRTDPHSPQYVGYLGDTVRNVTSVKLLDDVSINRNVAIVAGEGKGADRKIVTVDLSGGEPRAEMYVNAADLGRKYTVENPDGSSTEHTRTEAEYAAALEDRGRQELLNSYAGMTVAAGLAQTMMLFGHDYELGDILPIQLQKYGVTVKVRITEATIVYEKTRTIKAKLEVVK